MLSASVAQWDSRAADLLCASALSAWTPSSLSYAVSPPSVAWRNSNTTINSHNPLSQPSWSDADFVIYGLVWGCILTIIGNKLTHKTNSKWEYIRRRRPPMVHTPCQFGAGPEGSGLLEECAAAVEILVVLFAARHGEDASEVAHVVVLIALQLLQVLLLRHLQLFSAENKESSFSKEKTSAADPNSKNLIARERYDSHGGSVLGLYVFVHDERDFKHRKPKK